MDADQWEKYGSFNKNIAGFPGVAFSATVKPRKGY